MERILGRFASPVSMFFPEVYAEIDWSRGYEPLDTELAKILGDAATGSRRVDALYRVWLRTGEECWVLIHIEVQSQRDDEFPFRLFVYHHRLREFYSRPVASFALLADEDTAWRPTAYVQSFWGCRSEFHYPVVKLTDFLGHERELETSDNPFAVVILAHLLARETTDERSRRRMWKVRLLKGLYHRGWHREEVRQLLRIIDWFLKLPREDETIVHNQIVADEQEKQMPYVTSFEEIAMERGEARGLREGIELGIRHRFGDEGVRFMEEVAKLDDLPKLRQLAQAWYTAASIQDLRKIIAAQ